MPHRILLVEDSPIARALAVGWLEGAGYQVDVAENGHEGFEKAQAMQPDLVVSDINMPVQDGYWLCRQLKTNGLTERTPVIMLTQRDEAKDILEGLNAGADAFVIKSPDGDELLDRVARLLASQGAGGPNGETQVAELNEALVLTHDRKDILKLLYTVLVKEVPFDALAFLIPKETEPMFLVVSQTRLGERIESSFFGAMVETLQLITGQPVDPKKAKRDAMSLVDKERDAGAKEPQAALKVPLLVDGSLAGVMGVFSAESNAALDEKIRLFFELGVEGARALQRVSLEGNG